MIFFREDLSSKLLERYVFPVDIEGIKFRKCKWLQFGANHPPSQENQYYYNNLDKVLDAYCQYDKILLSGDFNYEISEVCLDSFLYQRDLKNLLKEKTCFKSESHLVA